MIELEIIKNVKSKPAKRFAVYLLVSCQKYGAASNADLRMRNLSSSGALLAVLGSRVSFDKGDLIRLKVILNEIASVKIVNAEVVWAKNAKLGVCFIKPKDVLLKLFNNYKETQ
jgi:hypothetical protein